MNTYTKITILAVLMVLAASLGLSAQVTTTGTLNLSGSVPGILEITVTPDAGAASLDLGIDAANTRVADVTERSNKKAGYTVSIESANAATSGSDSAFFSNTDPAVSSTLSYTITYGGSAVTLVGGSATVSDVAGKSTAAGTVNEVAISYNGASDFPYEGTYEDTLTFTIAAK